MHDLAKNWRFSFQPSGLSWKKRRFYYYFPFLTAISHHGLLSLVAYLSVWTCQNLNICCCLLQVHLKKSKQIFDILNSTHPNRRATKDIINDIFFHFSCQFTYSNFFWLFYPFFCWNFLPLFYLDSSILFLFRFFYPFSV